VELRLRDDLLRQPTTLDREHDQMKRVLRILAVILGVGLVARAAAAQDGQRVQAGRRVAAWVALAGEPIPGGEPFVVLRGVGPGRDDVLLLRTDTDASQLSNAVRTLLTARSVAGDTAARPGTFRMRRQQARTAAPADLPWADRVVRDVRGAPIRDLPGVGRVRAVRIWLPAVGARSRAGR